MQGVAVAVLVLPRFPVQRGASGGRADEETAGARIGRGPDQVANALNPNME
jgi:hypothetical protein